MWRLYSRCNLASVAVAAGVGVAVDDDHDETPLTATSMVLALPLLPSRSPDLGPTATQAPTQVRFVMDKLKTFYGQGPRTCRQGP